jgi:dienelactone hydrolase
MRPLPPQGSALSPELRALGKRQCSRASAPLILAIAAVVFGSIVVGASATPTRERAKIVVSPGKALVDQPVDVRVTGLPPSRKIVLVATARDLLRNGWRSRVVLTSSRGGMADTRSSMKLFWSMRPTQPSAAPTPFAFSRSEMSVLIRAQVEGHTVASGVLVRRIQAPDLTARDTTVAAEGFAGTYYTLPAGPPAPAVLALGGSAGGHGGGGAALFASHGYPTLSLGYFKEPGLPQELRRIPLEYFATALRWLASQPGVDPQRLVVLGVSRGGEAALLVGVHFPDLVHGVIECTGSAYVNGSVPEGDAAWTLGGQPVPYGPIPVERIAGPVLAFFGGKDGVGNPTPSERELVTRAREHGRKDIVVRVFPNAGHGVGCAVPNEPFVGQMEYTVAPSTYIDRGGTLAANEQAAAASWPLVLRFLRTLR